MMRESDFLTHPTRRFVFDLAEKLGRTVGELLYGSPNHRPITAYELMEWESLHNLRAEEERRANKRKG
jgi:hypothetical protein